MGERCVRIAEVEGSNPLLSTKGSRTNVKSKSVSLSLRESPTLPLSGIWGCIGFDGDVEAE